MGPWNNLPDWAQELEEHLEEGEAALFILHGQVYDYTRVNGDYLPFRHFLGQWLGRERHVVFYNLGAGLEFGDAAGEESFREALEPQEKTEDGEATEDVSLIRPGPPVPWAKNQSQPPNLYPRVPGKCCFCASGSWLPRPARTKASPWPWSWSTPKPSSPRWTSVPWESRTGPPWSPCCAGPGRRTCRSTAIW